MKGKANERTYIVLVGILLLIMAYLIAVQQKINLIHSYHCKRVSENDKTLFCKGVGIGNAVVGIGIILFPIMDFLVGETVALYSTGILTAAGLIIALATIIKYNKGLF